MSRKKGENDMIDFLQEAFSVLGIFWYGVALLLGMSLGFLAGAILVLAN